MAEAQTVQVAIIMGSESDWNTMSRTHQLLKDFDIPHSCRVLSAHRTPKEVVAFIEEMEVQGVEVFIAGAGLAAALPGVVAAHTTKPVLGVPLQSGALNGTDALYSIVQMPPGIPVGTLGIGNAGATNAALLALSILANTHLELGEKIADYRRDRAQKVLETKLPLGE